MTARPDGQYTDPLVGTDTSGPRYETRMHRKYELTTSINMLNVGVAPHELADTVPPDDPTLLDSTVGYCGGVLLTWNPALAQDLAVYWIQVVDPGTWTAWGDDWKYNCDDAPNTCVATSNIEGYGERVGFYVRNLSNGSTYHSRVFAQDNAGNFSRNPTNSVDFTVDPAPLKPLGAVVQGAVEADISGFKRLQVSFIPPVEYDTAQNPACIGEVDDEDGLWPTLRDLFGYRLYHRRQLSATPVDFTPDPVNDLVADEKNPGANPLKIPLVEYPDIKGCPCEYYAYKMASVTQCEDAHDDHTQTPPCLHTGEVSTISTDADGNPAAFLVPALIPGALPDIVPAQPLKPGAAAVPSAAPTDPDDYDIVLQVTPVFNSSIADGAGGFTPNPAADQQFEVWRYRIYEYTEDPALNPSATATLISDTDLTTHDDASWDALVDAVPPVPILSTAAQAKFPFTRPIPSGEKRWYTVAGVYNCNNAAGTDLLEGPQSLAVSVPCAAAWSLAVTRPAVDNEMVNAGGSVYDVVAQVTGLPSGTTITEMKITIGGTPVVNQPMAVTAAGSNATGNYAWNLTGLPDGSYPVMVTAVDNSGCSITASRIAVISQVCGSFQINTLNPGTGNLLTWEFQKVNGTEQYLLDQIGFTSSNYLTTALNYYATNPTVGSPTPTPLWTGAATDLNGKTIGANSTVSNYTYSMTNLCNANTSFRTLDLNPFDYPTATAGSSNWFRATYDKGLTAANGPLNLYGSFALRPCAPSTWTFNMPPSGTGTLTIPTAQLPVCAWSWTWGGSASKKPTVDATNLCSGTLKFTGKTGTGAGGLITVTYWTPSGLLNCSNMPIFLGP
jgi:hypothetical protein